MQTNDRSAVKEVALYYRRFGEGCLFRRFLRNVSSHLQDYTVSFEVHYSDFLTLVLFTFCTCCILRCLVCIIVSFLECIVVSCLVCIVVVVLCVML